MKTFVIVLSIALFFELGESFTKYGRTCKDIGCGSNEICVMAEDPCTWNSGDQCGTYPTCRKVSNEGPSCTRYVCPPTKICKLDGDTPKCVDDTSAHTPDNPKSHNNFASYNENTLGSNSGGDQPAYPVLPGQTTPRPAIRRPPGSGGSGGGYEGGTRGSGYPGQSQGSGYPGGYPRQNPNPSYPGQSGGYPNYQGGYGGQGYGGQGYGSQGGYSGQGGSHYQGGYSRPGNNQGGSGYYSQNNNRYGQKASSSDSNPLLDSITGSLKTWGTNILKNALGNIKL